ncbi:MAG: biotin transporter BioY [Thermoleophilia bacterium]|jgi:biotin transport system substrate-specific component|nr:biotin transporter BioY [Thermoleophilia bacterium]
MQLPRYGTLIDSVMPPVRERQMAIARDLVLIVSAVGLVAACAQITIPWFPVPLTGQTFAVLLVGGLLGFWRAGVALLAYWALGALGAPVFSDGDGGWGEAMSPSGGYIIGFILAAALVGWFADRGADRRLLTMISVLLIGNIIIYAVGVPWLAASTVVPGEGAFGWANAYEFGVEPFLLGDLVKLIAVAVLLPAGWALVRRAGLSRRNDGPRPGIM